VAGFVATTEVVAPESPQETVFDLLVIGGGINGAGIARDAAGRDLKVCLVEQDDLARHTSSASTKLIHGGLRYLEQGELRLVREALTERERLLRIAPHIIKPMRFVLPYVDGLRPRWLLRLGLFVYDHAGGRDRLAASQSLSLTDTPEGAPLLPSMHSGFEYSDCWVEDSRLVVLNVVDAAERGATVLTQTRVLRASASAGGWLVECVDRGGQQQQLHARALVNASGAWVNDVLDRLAITPRQRLRLVKGSHLIFRRLYEGNHAYLLQSPDQRVVFAIPYESDFTLVGTTDLPFDADPAQVAISDHERDYLLQTLNRFLRRPAVCADIVSSFAGVRPLYDDGSQSSAQKVSRDYQLELQHGENAAPVLSVYGGKITTYRRLAEAAMEILLPTLNRDMGETWTDREPLPGGDIPQADLAAFIDRAKARWPLLPPALTTRLAHLYGTRMTRILGSAQLMSDLGEQFENHLTAAEVNYLVANEWARSAEDILWRRTRLGLRSSASTVHHLQDAVAQLLRKH
jgi:glycerol-3-phosphate dehydrogenase